MLNGRQTGKMNASSRAQRIKADEVDLVASLTNMLRSGEMTSSEAVEQFCSIPVAKNFCHKFEGAEKEFRNHVRRYVSALRPESGIAFHETDRYTKPPKSAKVRQTPSPTPPPSTHDALSFIDVAVFATRRFKKGETIHLRGGVADLSEEQDDKLRAAGEKMDFSVLWSSRRNCFQLLLGPARFVNHDCRNNVEFCLVGENMWFKAIEDIEKDEELFTHYGIHYFEENNAGCLCATCEQRKCGAFTPAEKMVKKVPLPKIPPEPSRRSFRTINSTANPLVARRFLPDSGYPLRRSSSLSSCDGDNRRNERRLVSAPDPTKNVKRFVHPKLRPPPGYAENYTWDERKRIMRYIGGVRSSLLKTDSDSDVAALGVGFKLSKIALGKRKQADYDSDSTSTTSTSISRKTLKTTAKMAPLQRSHSAGHSKNSKTVKPDQVPASLQNKANKAAVKVAKKEAVGISRSISVPTPCSSSTSAKISRAKRALARAAMAEPLPGMDSTLTDFSSDHKSDSHREVATEGSVAASPISNAVNQECPEVDGSPGIGASSSSCAGRSESSICHNSNKISLGSQASHLSLNQIDHFIPGTSKQLMISLPIWDGSCTSGEWSSHSGSLQDFSGELCDGNNSSEDATNSNVKAESNGASEVESKATFSNGLTQAAVAGASGGLGDRERDDDDPNRRKDIPVTLLRTCEVASTEPPKIKAVDTEANDSELRGLNTSLPLPNVRTPPLTPRGEADHEVAALLMMMSAGSPASSDHPHPVDASLSVSTVDSYPSPYPTLSTATRTNSSATSAGSITSFDIIREPSIKLEEAKLSKRRSQRESSQSTDMLKDQMTSSVTSARSRRARSNSVKEAESPIRKNRRFEKEMYPVGVLPDASISPDRKPFLDNLKKSPISKGSAMSPFTSSTDSYLKRKPVQRMRSRSSRLTRPATLDTEPKAYSDSEVASARQTRRTQQIPGDIQSLISSPEVRAAVGGYDPESGRYVTQHEARRPTKSESPDIFSLSTLRGTRRTHPIDQDLRELIASPLVSAVAGGFDPTSGKYFARKSAGSCSPSGGGRGKDGSPRAASRGRLPLH